MKERGTHPPLTKMSGKAEFSLDRSLRSFMGYRLRRATGTTQLATIELLEKFDLRIKGYSVLTVVCDNPGVTQSQIATSLHLDHDDIDAEATKLKEAGFVLRSKDPNTKNAINLTATEIGRTVCGSATKAIKDLEQKFLKDFSSDELDLLNELLLRLQRGPM
ncbi:MAG: hypothetical protein JXR13_09775 [Thalassovita sp.]